jgi:hypothetical protein
MITLEHTTCTDTNELNAVLSNAGTKRILIVALGDTQANRRARADDLDRHAINQRSTDLQMLAHVLRQLSVTDVAAIKKQLAAEATA